jgi:hypothetical protein
MSTLQVTIIPRPNLQTVLRTGAPGLKGDKGDRGDVSGLQTALDGKQPSGDYATLVGGTVPASQLPSYVDDVLEFATIAAFPATGETGKIYVSTGSNKTYRWSGSSYVEMTSSPGSTDAVPEGATNLYFTAARAVSALASTLSSYATQAWVTAQGFATTSSVSSAISALVTGVSSVAGKTGAVTLSSADVTGLASVATSGSYADLSGKPTIPAAQVNSDWNATSGLAQILNKPTIPSASTDASLLTSGTLDDARLSSNVSLDNINNFFSVGQTITAAANTSALTASYSVTGANTTPLLNLSGTWNTTGAARGILLNITDTASNASSLLFDVQTAGTSRFNVDKNGAIFTRWDTSPTYGLSLGVPNFERFAIEGSSGSVSFVRLPAGGAYTWTNGYAKGTRDLFLARDAANTLALRNGGTAGTPVPQTFRLYNYTDAGLTNFERGFMRWNSNVLEIGTEAGGTGAARTTQINAASGIINFWSTFLMGSFNSGRFQANNSCGVSGSGAFDTNYGCQLVSTKPLGWVPGTNTQVAPDTALSRNAAGVVEINNGTAGTFRDLRVRNVIQRSGIATTVTPASNGDLVIEQTNDTSITFKMRGTDGTVRSASLTLA